MQTFRKKNTECKLCKRPKSPVSDHILNNELYNSRNNVLKSTYVWKPKTNKTKKKYWKYIGTYIGYHIDKL